MKLKEALRVAKEKGFKYIAVDSDKTMFMYMTKPKKDGFRGEWISKDRTTAMFYGDRYSGKKSWVNTLRKVK